MIQDQFSFKEFSFSSQIIRDLVEQKQNIAEFLPHFFSLSQISQQTERKEFSIDQRKTLTDALVLQNADIALSNASQSNINKLKESDTYTITTGHQLNLLSGPLYSIYKVAQVISLSRAMNESDPSKHYVPVFWMATEDHDFEEINHIHLFGNKIAWDKEGQENRIVGEIEPKGIESFTDPIFEKYSDENLKAILSSFTDIYKKSSNLAEATRSLMNQLFAEYGLVIIDGNDTALKQGFVPIAIKEINEGFVHKAVTNTNNKLEAAGYHNQVFVRECNLFYINAQGIRQRISKNGAIFEIEEKNYTAEELVRMVSENPKQFSPNALLRPVYQELILPNLTYIGGGGEIAYWLQLSDVFKALKLTFPLLRVRDSILLLKAKEIAELENLNLSVPNLKQDLQHLMKEIALEEVEFEIELKGELEQLNTIKVHLTEKAEAVNKGLVGMIEAEFSKMEKSIVRIESKLIKAEKAKHEVKGNKIKKLQSKIYPNGGFQERYENFIPYILNDKTFISKIVNNLTAQDQPLIRVLEI
ncbi:MAG: bacillithiol biosynthesis cysteine-adding enzyme BshC [Crocinitomix sp.]|nr:bacillithiol biosynthesis cysteine-adding enzyme BshC [Crocinitomix sp.]